MHPRLITHRSDGRSSMTGKSMMLESCPIEQVRIQSGRGVGARFMKKNVPAAPCGYRFMTIARSRMCGRSTGRSEEHTSELQSRSDLVCRLLLETKKK